MCIEDLGGVEPFARGLNARCPTVSGLKAPGPLAPRAAAGRSCFWCWLEDLNLPLLAYEASALPDELSQRGKLPKRGRGAAPGVEATFEGAPRLGAASEMDVHHI